MSSKEFVLGLSERIGTSEETTRKIIKYINKCIGNILEGGNGLFIPMIGAFVIEKRMERVVIDPTTQKRMLVPPKNLLKLVSNVDVHDMATMKHLSAELSRLSRLPDEVTDTIIHSFFGYIQIALQNDDNLTINGFGHFQTTSDAKGIVFTPSQSMNDLVNKPFSQFVPVILNDGVFFPDIEQEQEQHEQQPAESDNPVSLVSQQQQPETPPKTTTFETKESGSQDKGQEVNEKEEKEKPVASEPAADPIDTVYEPQEEAPASKPTKWSFLKKAALALLLVGIVFCVGYIIGHSFIDDEEKAVTEIAENKETQPVKETESETVKPRIDLDAVNAQVAYGAYRVTDIDTTIVVTKTQTVKNLAATYFGGEQMEMYIKALNGGKEMAEAGDTLLIPHLELK